MSVEACECANNWRVHLTLLTTGDIVKVLTPISFEFQMSFERAGQGSVTFNRQGIASGTAGLSGINSFVDMIEMYPRQVGIYFTRTAGGTATPENPETVFGGIVQTFDADSDGTVRLGFTEVQSYLDYRLIRSDLTFPSIDQRIIAANLVQYARGENSPLPSGGGSQDPILGPGITLFGAVAGGAGTIFRDRTYLASDRKYIGDALREFIEIVDGPTYFMDHNSPGLSFMAFADNWNQSTPYPTVTWHHLTDFKPNIDSNMMANLVDAFGRQVDGEDAFIESTGFVPVLVDAPRYDAAPVFDTVTVASTLQDHALGYLADHRDVAGQFQLIFSGLDYGTSAGESVLSIGDFIPGNYLNLDIRSPHWGFRSVVDQVDSAEQPRVGRLSVAAGPEGPEQVTVQLIAETMSSLVFGPNVELEPCFDC